MNTLRYALDALWLLIEGAFVQPARRWLWTRIPGDPTLRPVYDRDGEVVALVRVPGGRHE
jgi:hypothetical protein